MQKFETGRPLASGEELKISKRSKDFSDISKVQIDREQLLTPKKYKLPFMDGKSLAKTQKEVLDSLVVNKDSSTSITTAITAAPQNG